MSQNVFTWIKKRNKNDKNCPQLKQLEFDTYDNILSTLISNLETEQLHHNSTYLIVEDFYIDFWEISHETMSHVSF